MSFVCILPCHHFYSALHSGDNISEIGSTAQGINSRVTRVGTFEVCVPTHVALRMFIMQVLASQLNFLANKNAELATPPLFWPVNCIKIGEHVALLSNPTVYSLYCVGCIAPPFLSRFLPISSNGISSIVCHDALK